MNTLELYSDSADHDMNRSVPVTDALLSALPNVTEPFADFDAAYEENPHAVFSQLHQSLYRIPTREGGPAIPMALLFDEESDPSKLHLVFTPFSDIAPQSYPKDTVNYLAIEKPSIGDKEYAAPNSWGAILRAETARRVKAYYGSNVPHAVLFSPIPQKAYTAAERTQIKKEGDFSPAARLAKQMIKASAKILHGSQTADFSRLTAEGASLGASNVIAASNVLLREGLPVEAVTAQELVMTDGLWGLKKGLATRYTVRSILGEPTEEGTPYTDFISEPKIRRDLDAHGSEPIGNIARMLRGMQFPSAPGLHGMSRPERMQDEVVELSEKLGEKLLVALAMNSAVSEVTRNFMDAKGLSYLHLRGVEGQKLGHIVNEALSLSTIVRALNR